MSYLVLARKYRPQTFDEIVGQQHVTRTLTNAIKLARVAHAYLFTGTRGVGKTTAARILAKALNCKSFDGPTTEPCNTCPNCISITEGRSVDVFEIDGASNTGVDDVRELRESVRFMPQSSRFKVYVIDEVHMLSTNAFNALLKTLEEPPDHVVFIFATTEVHKIPDTVLSRCQQYDFKMIPQRQIYDHLKDIVTRESVKMDDGSLRLVARKADGSMRDAMSYLDQALSFGGDTVTTQDLIDILGVVDRQVLMELSASILAGGADAALNVMERLQSTTWDVKQFYGDLLEHFRNLVVAKVSKTPEAMIDTTQEEIDQLKEQAGKVSLETLQRLFDLLVENEDLVVRSGNPRLVLEMILLKMAYAAPVVDLDTLVEYLGDLKQAIAAGGTPSRPFPVGGAAKPEPTPPPAKTPEAPKPSVPEPKSPEPAPTPASAPKPEPEGLKPGELAEAFLTLLKSASQTVALFFEKARLLEDTGSKLKYGIDDRFMLEQIQSMSADWEPSLKKAGGEKAKIELVEMAPDRKRENKLAKATRQKQELQAKMTKLKREIMGHEAVKTVGELFENTEIFVSALDPETGENDPE